MDFGVVAGLYKRRMACKNKTTYATIATAGARAGTIVKILTLG